MSTLLCDLLLVVCRIADQTVHACSTDHDDGYSHVLSEPTSGNGNRWTGVVGDDERVIRCALRVESLESLVSSIE